MNYRRAYIPGGTFFFTLVTYNRIKLFHQTKNITILKNAFNYVKHRHPFTMQGYVILPDHLHCIWTLPTDDADFSKRWRLLKTYFTREFYKTNHIDTFAKDPIWQKRFWEHTIQNEKDFENLMDYIHYNPIKHNYAKRANQWPHSSIHYYIEKGIYQKDWGEAEIFQFEDIRE